MAFPQILSSLFGGNNPVSTVANIADKFITTKGDKMKFETELINLFNSVEISAQEFVSNRHQVDMSSDSWLSKNIRPMALVFLLIMYTLFAFTDGNIGEFNVKQSYIDAYTEFLKYTFGFYFIGRSGEKIMSMYKNGAKGFSDVFNKDKKNRRR